jgi:hypothetical protein
MSRVYYVDTSRTAYGKRRRKLHYVYDGQKIIKVRKLTRLKDASEIFIDSLFPEIYADILWLLKDGTKVYLLKYPSILEEFRVKSDMKKSDENDAILLSKISGSEFRALTIQEMERKVKVQPLINKYELLSKRIKTLKMWIKRDGYDYRLRDSLRLMEEDKEETAKKIIGIFSDDAIKRGIVEPSCKELIDMITMEPRNRVLFKLQAKILKILKNVWKTANEVRHEFAGR